MPPINVFGTPILMPAPWFPAFIPGVQPQFEDTDTISPDDAPGDQDMCELLATNKPPGCSLETYPPMPGHEGHPGWPSASGFPFAPNGCGSGALRESFIAWGWSHLPGNEFSGNLDRPVKGDPSVVFSAACNAHDACYAGLWASKRQCDLNFGSTLMNACKRAADAACGDFASIYYLAVNNKGQEAWNNAHAGAVCSNWAHAMKEHECGQP